MPSSEFRKRYATLRQRTRVTVLGRVIGEWIPATTEVGSTQVVVVEPAHRFGKPRPAPKR